jgi:hypothetical protein
MKNQCLALLFLGLLACALAQDNTVTVTKATETVPTTQIVGSTATTVCPRSTRTHAHALAHAASFFCTTGNRRSACAHAVDLFGVLAQPVLDVVSAHNNNSHPLHQPPPFYDPQGTISRSLRFFF